MNRDEAQRIASAISIIRPDWLASSLLTTLGKLPAHLKARPARDVHLALAWLAHDPEQRTPRLLSESGPWWQLTTQPGNAPMLPTWRDPFADTTPADPDIIRAIRTRKDRPDREDHARAAPPVTRSDPPTVTGSRTRRVDSPTAPPRHTTTPTTNQPKIER